MSRVGFVVCVGLGVGVVGCGDDATGPALGDACQVARDCQDGDLCNGAERCEAGFCVDGEPPAMCPVPVDAGCGGVCADDERCDAGACEVVCLPPSVPLFSVVPVGARFVVPPEVDVYVATESARTRPGRPVDLDTGNGLLFASPGRVVVDAFWTEPGECEVSFRGVYEVVERVDSAPESGAIAMDDARIVAWAAGFSDVVWGSDLDASWMDPTRALGPAMGTWDDAVSLGNGGAMTFVFEEAIADGVGPDLAVFENGFSESFLELAFVEVSSNGVDFVRFPSLSIQTAAVGPYGTLDPSEVIGVAGRYRAGFGTPFDLGHLAQTAEVLTGRVDLGAIGFVRIVDLVGDGSMKDSFGNPIYDPTPTVGPAGFDVDAVGALRWR